jgi:hypothetical protein
MQNVQWFPCRELREDLMSQKIKIKFSMCAALIMDRHEHLVTVKNMRKTIFLFRYLLFASLPNLFQRVQEQHFESLMKLFFDHGTAVKMTQTSISNIKFFINFNFRGSRAMIIHHLTKVFDVLICITNTFKRSIL